MMNASILRNHTFPHMYPLVFFWPSSWYDPSSFTQKCGLPAHWTPANCNVEEKFQLTLHINQLQQWFYMSRKSIQPATSEALL